MTDLFKGERLYTEAEVDRAKREARVEALTEAARMVDCGCDPETKARVLSVPPNSADRWRGCGQANCGAMDAAAIRALIEKEGKP